ncbi:MAG: DUF445 domain-containing protein [Pseudomonadota bacterium]
MTPTVDPVAAATLPPIDHSDRRIGELRRMRIWATSLLVLMAVIFIAASLLDTSRPWLGYVRAFAEASMVGACADWFAVVALFRHPFGIPIPHTAIVPHNKARIGDTIGAFVRNNFLAPAVVAARLERIDAAGWWAGYLARPGNAALIAQRSADFLAPVVGLLEREQIHGFLCDATRRGLRAIPAASVAARVLAMLLKNGQLLALAEWAIEHGDASLTRNNQLLREKVSGHTSWWIPKWLDEKIADRMLTGVRGSLIEMRKPDHPWRGHFVRLVEEQIGKLDRDPETIAAGERVKDELLDNPAVAEQIDGLWRALETKLRDGAGAGFVEGFVESALQTLGRWLTDDAALRALLNRWVQGLIESTVVPHRDEIGAFVAEVVKRWDDRTLVAKMELAVGKDLQYVRINGTLVGGLVGLLIHAASQLAAGIDLSRWFLGAP